jgi:hypothetical protein
MESVSGYCVVMGSVLALLAACVCCQMETSAYEWFPRPPVFARLLLPPVSVVFPRAAPPRFPPRCAPRAKTAWVGRSVVVVVAGAPLPRPRPAAPRVKGLLLWLLPRAPRPRSPPLPPRGVDMSAAVSWVRRGHASAWCWRGKVLRQGEGDSGQGVALGRPCRWLKSTAVALVATKSRRGVQCISKPTSAEVTRLCRRHVVRQPSPPRDMIWDV